MPAQPREQAGGDMTRFSFIVTLLAGILTRFDRLAGFLSGFPHRNIDRFAPRGVVYGTMDFDTGRVVYQLGDFEWVTSEELDDRKQQYLGGWHPASRGVPRETPPQA